MTYKSLTKLLMPILLVAIGIGIFCYTKMDPKEEKQLQSTPQQSKKQSEQGKYLLLVNKSHRLSANYLPKNLIVPKVPCAKAGVSLVAEAAAALKNLFKGASRQGFEFQAISGYRSYGAQKIIYNQSIKTYGKNHTSKYVAIPGASEHQTGLAMDVGLLSKTTLNTSFGNTRAGKWLAQHAKDYGFIIRYPKGKEHITGYAYEPWHIRYVGKKVAKKIFESKLTLEEYLNYN